MKDLVFRELKKKMNNIDDTASYRRFTEHRGQWALQRKGYYQEFGWSVGAEFYESILLWYIATHLLFHDFKMAQRTAASETAAGTTAGNGTSIADGTAGGIGAGIAPGITVGIEEGTKLNSEPEISHDISNYMMFLLIVRPFMMPAGIGQIRFRDICAEAKNFLQQQGHINMDDAVTKILEMNMDCDPALVKGDRSKSVLFKGCMLAHNLKNEFTSKENGKNVLDCNKMWRLISVVWAEMLCYAASKCSGQFHENN